MECPNCKANAFIFTQLWLWPFGKKQCTACEQYCKVKTNPILSASSFFLGALSAVPPLLLANILYFLPSLMLVLTIDYFMDKKYRQLVHFEIAPTDKKK